MIEGISVLGALKIQDDPEAIFQEGWLLCDVGEYELGLGHLQRAVSKNYFVVETLARSRQFEALRGDARFRDAAGRGGGRPQPRACGVP